MITAGIEFAAEGAGDPVVFLHGIGGGIESFRPQLDSAGGKSHTTRNGVEIGPTQASPHDADTGLHGFRALAWNMPGYGASETTRWPPGFDTLSEVLGRFIAATGYGTVHLAGHSLGGMLALEHALRRPEQVKSLVLIGTTPGFGGRDASFGDAFLKARLAPLDAGEGMADLARNSAPNLVGPDASPEVVARVEEQLATVTEKTWRGILKCLVTFNRRDDLGRVAQPCCLIAGGHDQNAPARTMARMAERIGSAEFHLIENAGHMINQEDPDRTNDIIGSFLRQGQT